MAKTPKRARKWYRFRQNNSGGRWSVDERVAETVFVQEYTAERANEKAQSVGLYFNGVADGYDCPCCGDRWHPQHSETDECYVTPEIPLEGVYAPVWGRAPYALSDARTPASRAVFHHLDGRVQYGAPDLANVTPMED
jgi:hypothetical protein